MMFCVIIAKFLYILLRFLKKGATSFPGKIALKLKPNILNRLSKNVNIICVTGTNGKTTTCAFLEHYFKSQGLSYFINKGGANMISGVVSAFIANSTIFGVCKKKYAILECDENSLPEISKHLDAKIIVVTNIFNDQLDRYGDITYVFNQIKRSIKNMPNAKLVVNADCPLAYSLTQYCDNLCYTFGTNFNLNCEYSSESCYCPICSNKLSYHTKVLANLGNYYCTNCSFKRPRLDFAITDLIVANENGCRFLYSVNRKIYESKISVGGVYNIYNFSACALTLLLLGQSKISTLSSFDGAFGRIESFKCGNKSIRLMLVKNTVGLSSCLSYCAKLKGNYNYVFALNDNYSDGRDISWVWGANIENELNNYNRFYTVGLRSFDAALWLKYSSLPIDTIIDGENYSALIDEIEKGSNDFIILANYTSMMKIRHQLIAKFGGKEFWL